MRTHRTLLTPGGLSRMEIPRFPSGSAVAEGVERASHSTPRIVDDAHLSCRLAASPLG